MPEETFIKGAQAVSLFCRLNNTIKKDLPVRASEMGLLILAVKHETPLTPVMAADVFKVKKPMITAMAKALIAHGYLVKTPAAEDKRSHILTPTAKGAALVGDTYAAYHSTMRLLSSRLGAADFDALIGLIDRANLILLEERDNG